MLFYGKRLLSFLITLFAISGLTFFALQVLPGDPAVLVLGTEGDAQSLFALRAQLGLDQPPLIRYLTWIRGVFSFDFGMSIRYSFPVADLIKQALPVTLSLAFSGILVTLLVAVPFGVLSALREGRLVDWVLVFFSLLGMSVPSFSLGIILVGLFSLRYPLFPPMGYVPITEGLALHMRSLFLPALAIGLPRGAVLLRLVRRSMLEVLPMDYIRTAKAKGLPKGSVFYKHALRNAGTLILTASGIHLTQLLAGTIIIEQVFSLPGIGQLLLHGVLQRDLPLVQGIVFLGATLIMGSAFLLDLLLTLVDPRVRYE